MKSLEKNQKIELEITATGSQGEGIGRHDGLAVFVPAAAEGDKIIAHIVKVQKNLAYARIAEIIEPSPERVEADCEVFPKCGGCSFRHISYDAECRIKRTRVADAMKRIGGLDIEPERFIACDSPDRYRNKAQLPCQLGNDGEVHFGFFAERSHRVVECADCKLQPREFSDIIAAMKRYMKLSGAQPYNELEHKGLVRHLYLRRSRSTGEIMVCVVINGKKLPREDLLTAMLREASSNIAGILINVNTEKTNVILGAQCRTLWGSEFIYDSLLATKFRISPLSFFQVNPAQAEKLYSAAAEYAGLTGGETVLDMYCGAGTIGLTMAAKCGKLIGAEIVPEAIEDAKVNARLNNIENAEFICADAAQAAETLEKRGLKPAVIVLDPPRKGCEPAVLETLAKMSPCRIVYVSCDPATLARDVKLLSTLGYTADRLTAVDMFPRSAHVETVVLLSRDKEK